MVASPRRVHTVLGYRDGEPSAWHDYQDSCMALSCIDLETQDTCPNSKQMWVKDTGIAYTIRIRARSVDPLHACGARAIPSYTIRILLPCP